MIKIKDEIKKRIHIISKNDRWIVRKEGSKKASKIFTDVEDAKFFSKKYRKLGYDIILHRKNGEVKKWIKTPKTCNVCGKPSTGNVCIKCYRKNKYNK